MTRTFSMLSAAICLTLLAGSALANNELALYVFRDRNPAEGLTIEFDGGEEKQVGGDGGVFFDLTPGAHSVQIRDNGNTLHTFRFDSAAGQYVDISVLLLGLDRPRVRVEQHFKNETAEVRAEAATGTILGRITTSNGAPVANTPIEVRRTQITTMTDADGNYKLILPRGIYTVAVLDPDLGKQEIDNVRVVANVERGANFTLRGGVADLGIDIQRPSIEEIVAVAKYNPVALGESERYSQGVVDMLGIGELARFGDSDVAASVVRIPAVTVVDDRFIFIRGLGGRYITTTLNGATLPSTDPVKRTVPLDLFPTNIVNQLDIKKTFVSSMPGESTGGNLVINTRTFPADGGGQFNFSLGGTTNLTGRDVWADPIRADFDWAGYDDGERSDNSPLRAISDVLEYTDILGPQGPVIHQELQRLGGILMKDDWDVVKRTANPDISFGASYGDVWDLDWRDAEFGVFAAANYKNEWSQREGIERTYDNQSEVLDDFAFDEYSNEVDISGLFSIGLNVGNGSYSSNTLYSHIGGGRTKVRAGFDGDELLPSIRNTIEWVEREFISQQFTGNHILGEDENWILNWQTTGSRATRDAPNRRDVRFDLRGNDGIYNLIVPELAKRYDELVDDNLDASLDLERSFSSDRAETTVSFGAQVIHRERDSDSETYGYFGGVTIPGIDNAANTRVDDILTIGNITGDTSTGFAFLDKTLSSDSYEAELDLNSVYFSLDSLINDTYQLVVGARYEDYEQVTDTFQTEGAQGPVRSRLDESELLPALGLNILLSEQQQLRFALTKTISRPDFKETSNAVFFDPDFDIRVRGNPLLQTSSALNFDVRYEYYWDDRDSASVAVFSKELDDPIERVVVTASGTAGNTRTFENADKATVYGFEIDGRKEFGLNDSLTRTFFIYGNYSWIDSEVDLGAEKRKLQGQPDYTFNVVVGYDDIENNQEVTLLMNQNGESIVDVGVSGLPNIISEPRFELGLRYKWFFSDNWQLRVKLDNILDSETEFTQGGQPFQVYETGREFEIGLNYDF